MKLSWGIGGIGLPYWSTGCRRPEGSCCGIGTESEPFPPALLTVFSEGFRWLSGVMSSAVAVFCKSYAA
jgi:hypothetical protein